MPSVGPQDEAVCLLAPGPRPAGGGHAVRPRSHSERPWREQVFLSQGVCLTSITGKEAGPSGPSPCPRATT